MKSQRHEKILELVNSQPIERQEQLKELLFTDGIDVTQATLSRDIRELGLKKVSRGGITRYSVPDAKLEKLPAMLRDAVTDIDSALNTVVFKCHTGMAQAACATFDRMDYPEVVGTLAGDDTIFVLMRSEKEARRFVSDMCRVFNSGKGEPDAE